MIVVCTFLTLQPEQEALPQPDFILDYEDTTSPGLFNFTDEEIGNVTLVVSPADVYSVVPINWCLVGRGMMVSMSQVYGINDVVASGLMNLAVFLASPLLWMMCTVGGAIGTLMGVLLLPRDDLQEVYDGVWGYNAILSMASLSCVFFAFNSMSFLIGILNVLATVVAHYALRTNMFVKVRRLLPQHQ